MNLYIYICANAHLNTQSRRSHQASIHQHQSRRSDSTLEEIRCLKMIKTMAVKCYDVRLKLVPRLITLRKGGWLKNHLFHTWITYTCRHLDRCRAPWISTFVTVSSNYLWVLPAFQTLQLIFYTLWGIFTSKPSFIATWGENGDTKTGPQVSREAASGTGDTKVNAKAQTDGDTAGDTKAKAQIWCKKGDTKAARQVSREAASGTGYTKANAKAKALSFFANQYSNF